MKIRSCVSRLFDLRNVGIISLFFLLGFMVRPSKREASLVHTSSQSVRQASPTPANGEAVQAEQARVLGRYGNLPLAFEVNQGQTHTKVKFLSRGSGYALFLTTDEAVLALKKGQNGNPKLETVKRKSETRNSKLETRHSSTRHSSLGTRHWSEATDNGPRTTDAVLRMKLVGANPKALVTGTDELPGKSNYFIGNDPKKWRTNVPTYAKVKYESVYPGVDLVYYGRHGQLEYDFVVAPGADPRAIALEIGSGQSKSQNLKSKIDTNGDLVVKIDGGEVRFHKPTIYQPASDTGLRVRRDAVLNPKSKIENPKSVDGKYVLKSHNRVTFEVASYDRSRPLIIDPILFYSTYLGGTNIDGGKGIAVAPDGSAFITGGTFSADFLTAHPLQPNAGGPRDFPQDAFVSKISADGATLLYSTYLGGHLQDFGNGIAVDTFGNAYVVGTTFSSDFPVTPGSVSTLCGGDGRCGASYNPQSYIVSNAFISKLNAAGTELFYSTFLGYYENVEGLAVATDDEGSAYVTGETGPNLTVTTLVPPPPPFPVVGGFQPPVATPTLPGGYGPGVAGGTDAFVTRISASGANILYSTYVGGSSEEIGYAIAATNDGSAYIAGLTYSIDFPTKSPFQAAYAGAGDAFVTKIKTTATGAASLVYSTYLGGGGLDQGNGLALDSGGSAYLTGPTCSTDFPLASPLQPARGGDCDAFVSKLNPAGTALVYSTYLGGSLADSGAGIAVDTSGNAYVTGSTVSKDFPIAGTAFQPKYGGGNADAFVAELDAAGATLVYSSYLGGTNTDSGAGIAVDTGTPASAYVTGQTCSLDFPLANPLQTTGIGNCDVFVSKVSILTGIALNPAGLAFPTQSIGTASQPQSVTLTNGNATLSITSIVVTGVNAGDFSETNTCGTSVAAGAQCDISVIFTPTAAGVRRAAVTITDSVPGSPHVIPLTGSTSTVGLSASSLSFGNQPVGVTSSPQTVRVTNEGTTALTISAAVASGDFAVTTNCTAAPLQPTTNCVITVTYTPSVPGSSVGALTMADNAAGSPQVILLTGTGVVEPLVTLSATSLTFANQPIGATSAVQQITVGNTGSAPLKISSITASGDFTQDNTCGSSLAVKANCTISVTFTPAAAGSRTGSLTMTDNAPDSPQVVSLGGNGSDFALSVSPPSNSVPAGLSASYTLTVAPSSGFNAQVTLGCSGAPRGGTCSVSPPTVTPNGTNPVTATVTVRTATRSLAPPELRPRGTWPHFVGQVGPLWYLAALLLMVWVGLALGRRRRILLGLALVMCLVLFWAACGGGTQVDVPAGTPAGSYTLTLSGSSGTVTHNASVNLTVM